MMKRVMWTAMIAWLSMTIHYSMNVQSVCTLVQCHAFNSHNVQSFVCVPKSGWWLVIVV